MKKTLLLLLTVSCQLYCMTEDPILTSKAQEKIQPEFFAEFSTLFNNEYKKIDAEIAKSLKVIGLVRASINPTQKD